MADTWYPECNIVSLSTPRHPNDTSVEHYLSLSLSMVTAAPPREEFVQDWRQNQEKLINLPVCMNGWVSPSGSRWFHRIIPNGTAENCPGFPPPQDSPSLSVSESGSQLFTSDTSKWQSFTRTGKLVPSPYKRSKLSNRVFCSVWQELFSLTNLIKEPTCFKNICTPFLLDVFLTNSKPLCTRTLNFSPWGQWLP